MPSPRSFNCCLEQSNIIAAIGSAGGDDDEYLRAYKYNTTTRKKKDQVECWVAAVPEKRFCVHWGYEGDPAERLGQGLKCYIYIDGAPAAVGYMPPEFVQDGRDMEITGFQRLDSVELPFCFGRREVTDEHTISSREKPKDMLGRIEVVVFWARIDETGEGSEEEPDTDGDKCVENEEAIMKPVLEKDMKVRHEFAATLGDPEASQAMRTKYKTERVDRRDYRFVFHYAPKDWLILHLDTKKASQLATKHKASREPRVEPSRTATDPVPPRADPRTPARETPHAPPRASTQPSRHAPSRSPLFTAPCTPFQTPPRTPPRTRKRQAVEVIDVDAWDKDVKRKSSTGVKRAYTEEVKPPGAVPLAECIDQWRLGC